MTYTKALIYISKDRFDYFDHSLPKLLTFPYPDTLVKDLDILNPEALSIQIKSFIENNKLALAQIMIVLAPDVYFERDFATTFEFHMDSELSKFIEAVPFENCSSKIYKVDSSAKLIATNADLYNGVKSSFESAGFITEGIIPLFILGKDIVPGISLDVQTARIMLERYELAKQNSLLIHQDLFSKDQNSKDKKNRKDDNRTLVFLIPIFIMLIIVLAILYLKTSSPSTPPKLLPTPTIPKDRVYTIPTIIPTNIATISGNLNNNNISSYDGSLNQPNQ